MKVYKAGFLCGLMVLSGVAFPSFAVCPPPDTPVIVAITSNSVTATWTSASNQGDNSFIAFLTEGSNPVQGDWQQFIPAGAPQEVTFSNLFPGTSFNLLIIEFCSGYNGRSLSASTNFMTLGTGNATGCNPPNAPSIDALTAKSATISWSSPNNDPQHGYQIIVQSDANPPNGLWVLYRFIKRAPGEPLSYTISNLVPRAYYRVAILEYCDANEGHNFSSFTSFQALGPSVPGTCLAPTVLLTKMMPTYLEMAWFSPNSDTNHVFMPSLFYDADPPNDIWVNYQSAELPAGSPNVWTFSNLVENARYRVGVVEFCDGTNTGGAVSSASVFFNTVGPYLIDLHPVDAGRYDHTGTHNPSDTSYLAGYAGAGNYSRNWFAFDLPALTNTVTAVALRLHAYDVVSTSLVERYVLHSVTTTPAAVQAGGFGLTNIYHDLGTGTVLAERAIFVSESSSDIQIALNQSGRILIGAAPLSTIVLGGAMDTLEGLGGFGEYAFGSSGSLTNIRLLIHMNGYTPPDSDGDGVNDLDEEVAGTDANSPTSYFWINALAAGSSSGGTNTVVLHWPSVAARWYRVESTTNLAGGGPYTVLTNGMLPSLPFAAFTNVIQPGAPISIYRVFVTSQPPN